MAPTTPTTAPSGRQHEIVDGGQRAVVTEVGAALRHYSVGEVDVVDGFDAGEISTDGRGQVLAPWPNRLDHGRYRFGEREGVAPLDEPDRMNAIHGLVRWMPWAATASTPASIDLRCELQEQPAYPWHLELAVRYELSAAGLEVAMLVTNRSPVSAPFGLGFHPYLTVGGAIDDASVWIPAARRLVTDDRGLPIGDEPVVGTGFDFTNPRVLGATQLDTAFTDLLRGSDGIARTTLSSPDGERSVTVWVDDGFGYLMVYTGDRVRAPTRRRRAVAIEPMTCPPNALRSGIGVLSIEPGGVVERRWGIAPS